MEIYYQFSSASSFKSAAFQAVTFSLILRPEGPVENRPERQLGTERCLVMRPEGPAQTGMKVPHLQRS